jgi:hypothetical protein
MQVGYLYRLSMQKELGRVSTYRTITSTITLLQDTRNSLCRGLCVPPGMGIKSTIFTVDLLSSFSSNE